MRAIAGIRKFKKPNQNQLSKTFRDAKQIKKINATKPDDGNKTALDDALEQFYQFLPKDKRDEVKRSTVAPVTQGFNDVPENKNAANRFTQPKPAVGSQRKASGRRAKHGPRRK